MIRCAIRAVLFLRMSSFVRLVPRVVSCLIQLLRPYYPEWITVYLMFQIQLLCPYYPEWITVYSLPLLKTMNKDIFKYIF